ncbi:MAG: hypothetical protein GC168_07785 [Candidatus Hydrogenedens sp.]|nr:hypothetical protein [Candidatus Hydrogenedens sp.]
MSKPEKKKKKKAAQAGESSGTRDTAAKRNNDAAEVVDTLLTAHSNELLLIVEAERRQREHLERRLKDAEARLQKTLERIEQPDPTMDLLQLQGQLAAEAEQAAALEALEVTLLQAELQANSAAALSPAPAWPKRRPELLTPSLLAAAAEPSAARPAATVPDDAELTKARLAIDAAEARAAHSSQQVKHLAEELAHARAEQVRLARELREVKAKVETAELDFRSEPAWNVDPSAAGGGIALADAPMPLEPADEFAPLESPAETDEAGESLEDALAAFAGADQATETVAGTPAQDSSLEDALLGWAETGRESEEEATLELQPEPEAEQVEPESSLEDVLLGWGEAESPKDEAPAYEESTDDSLLSALEMFGGSEPAAPAPEIAPEETSDLLDALEQWGGISESAPAPASEAPILEMEELQAEPAPEPAESHYGDDTPSAKDALFAAFLGEEEAELSEEAPAEPEPVFETVDPEVPEEQPVLEIVEVEMESEPVAAEADAGSEILEQTETDFDASQDAISVIIEDVEPYGEEPAAASLEVDMLESLDPGDAASSARIADALSGAPNALDLAEEDEEIEAVPSRPKGILGRLQEAALSRRSKASAEPVPPVAFEEDADAIEEADAAVAPPGQEEFESEEASWADPDAYPVTAYEEFDGTSAEEGESLVEEAIDDAYRPAEYGTEWEEVDEDEAELLESVVSEAPVTDEFDASAAAHGDPLAGDFGEPEPEVVEYLDAPVAPAPEEAEPEFAQEPEPVPEAEPETVVEDFTPTEPEAEPTGMTDIAAAVRRAREQRVAAMETAEAPVLHPVAREEAAAPERAEKRKSMASALQRFIGQ